MSAAMWGSSPDSRRGSSTFQLVPSTASRRTLFRFRSASRDTSAYSALRTSGSRSIFRGRSGGMSLTAGRNAATRRSRPRRNTRRLLQAMLMGRCLSICAARRGRSPAGLPPTAPSTHSGSAFDKTAPPPPDHRATGHVTVSRVLIGASSRPSAGLIIAMGGNAIQPGFVTRSARRAPAEGRPSPGADSPPSSPPAVAGKA